MIAGYYDPNDEYTVPYAYGIIGVKVWIYKGEVLTGSPREHRLNEEKKAAEERARQPRRDRRDGGRGRFDRNDRRPPRREGGNR